MPVGPSPSLFFSNLLSFNQLVALDKNQQEILARFERRIERNNPADIKDLIENFYTYSTRCLLACSQASKKFLELCQRPEYQAHWQKLFEQRRNYKAKEGPHNSFDLLMGAFVYAQYYQYVKIGFAHHPEARKLLQFAESHGIENSHGPTHTKDSQLASGYSVKSPVLGKSL